MSNPLFNSRAPVNLRRWVLLDKTVAHFNHNNRALDPEGRFCVYDHSASGGCAIGRELPPELAAALPQRAQVDLPQVFFELPAGFRELGGDFLPQVQTLHDGGQYWDELGLSETGKAVLQTLVEQFGLRDEFDDAVDWLTKNFSRSNVFNAWIDPSEEPGGALFRPTGEYCRGFGCLTQIKAKEFAAPTTELTAAIRTDPAIPTDSDGVTPESLPHFARWQRRLELELWDLRHP